MARGWSLEEVEATVGDYLDMLRAELRGEAYSKAEHRRRLRRALTDRTDAAIELKHGNISAVLNSIGFPSIRGYQPYGNYQNLLYEVVATRVAESPDLHAAAAASADRRAPVPRILDFNSVLTNPPSRTVSGAPSRVMERPTPRAPAPKVNYLEREARNSALGIAGEAFVIRYERERLTRAGLLRLAKLIEHVARTRGASLGYDIRSFDSDGGERFIEVKTTKYGKATPFFVSDNEVRTSEVLARRYVLYRVFEFTSVPRIFTLSGSIRQACQLNPTTYAATVA